MITFSMEEMSYRQYQNRVRKGAWKKFSQKHGIPDLIISLVVSVIVGILSNSLYLAMITLGVFYLIYSVIYLGYFAKEHVAIFNKQQKTIDAFWPKELKLIVRDSFNSGAKDEEGVITGLIKDLLQQTYRNTSTSRRANDR